MGLKNIDSWSEEEIKLLKEKYPHYTNKELVKRFFPNRNAESIRTMANKNGIIKSNKKKSKWYNEENLINDLKELAIKLNRTPRIFEIKLYNLPSEATYRRYFGSYSNACEIADLDLNMCLFGESLKVYKSMNGDKCFSQAEVIITDFFILNNIPYKKEEYYKDYINDNRCKTKRCDWIIYDNIFVEYFGLPDKSYYYKKMEVKRDICKDNDIKLIELFKKDLETLNTIFLK